MKPNSIELVQEKEHIASIIKDKLEQSKIPKDETVIKEKKNVAERKTKSFFKHSDGSSRSFSLRRKKSVSSLSESQPAESIGFSLNRRLEADKNVSTSENKQTEDPVTRRVKRLTIKKQILICPSTFKLLKNIWEAGMSIIDLFFLFTVFTDFIL